MLLRFRVENHRSIRAVIVTRLALLDADGPTGQFHDENGLVPW
jgi:hypothetical protein